MKKKSIIILSSVVAICAIGLITSHFVDWPVDSNDTSGDIAKATRFSREQASEKLTNMEELLQTDSAFKDGIVAAQVVMQTRAAQFGTLVDMSNEVAGNIPAFAEVLKEMNAAREMVDNVSTSLVESGDNLNAALGGEECPDLAQSTINASLAYTTLQKQNKLADRFIEVTDKYLETAQGNDQLKFVRDQWLEYQQVTAALEGDNASAEALAKKGNLLSGEKALAAVGQFSLSQQISILTSSHIAKSVNVDTKLGNAIPENVYNQVVSTIRSAAEATMQQIATSNVALQSQQIEKIFCNAVNVAMKNVSNDVVANRICVGLQNANKVSLQNANKVSLQNANKVSLQNANKVSLQNANKVSLQNANKNTLEMSPIFMQTIKMANATHVMSAFDVMVSNVASSSALRQSQNINLSNRIGEVISQTAAANNSEKLNRKPGPPIEK